MIPSIVQTRRHRLVGGAPFSTTLAAVLLLALTCLPVALSAQTTGAITGRVTNAATGQPLGDVQISLVGQDIGTLTQPNGRYLIPNVPTGSYTIEAISLGFTSVSHEVTVGSGESALVDFDLSSTAIDLEEIVITGTAGAARRREIGNSISSLRAEDLESEPILSAQDILVGTTAGVQIATNEGAPGAGGSIRIRGVNSLTQGNRPLIYVDGVRMENNDLPTTYSNAARSPLQDINPSDIERMEVIKGAAATTLYGTEAAGGVIQIFTKRGGGGAATWQAEITQGLVSSPQIGPDIPASMMSEYPDAKDLFMAQYLQTGWNQRYNLSVSGRTDTGGISYFVSGGWQDDEGVLPKQANEQLSLRGNVGFQPTEWLAVQFNNSLSQAANVWLPLGNLAKGFSLNVFRGPFDYVTDQNEVFLTQYDIQSETNHFTSGLEFRATPVTDFTMKLNLGLDYIDDDYGRAEFFGSLLQPEGIRQERRWKSETRTVDFVSSYSKDISGISTSTSAGFQVFQNKLLEVDAESTNFAGPGTPTLNTGSQQTATEDRLQEVNAGFFFQEVLGFSDKLFITGGMRIDGNSAFGDDYGLQFYPKVSASYVISDDDFWPEFFNSTKLRAAYGESGKAPGFFDASRTWDPISALEGQPGVTPANQGNPDLGPERTAELEGGFEATMLDSRLAIDFSYYTQTTTDALIAVPQDPSLGFLEPQIANVGEIKNSGIEIAADATLYQGNTVTWNLGTAMSFSESEVVELGGSSSIFLGGSLTPGMFAREGYSLPGYFGAVVQNPNEVGAPVTEEEFIGPMYPTRMVSFDSQLRLGDSFTLTGRAEHQGGHYQLSHTSYRNTQRSVWPTCFDVAQAVDAGNTSTLTAQERFQCSPSEVNWAAHIWPVDFWRLRSVAVNYVLPEDFLGGRFGNVTLSVGGRNLWMISTKYGGVDPEANDDADSLTRHEYYQMPVPKTFTFSIRTQF